jgi:hypothetical protein
MNGVAEMIDAAEGGKNIFSVDLAHSDEGHVHDA